MKENAHAGAVEAISVENMKFAVIFRVQTVMSFSLEEDGR
jgi:hypothetical protein